MNQSTLTSSELGQKINDPVVSATSTQSDAKAPVAEAKRNQWGFWVMAAVLLLAAGLKSMSFVFPTRWLDQPNAIFPFTERWVLVLAIAVDVGVALALLSRKLDYATKLLIGGWLLGVFALYRAGLYWLGNPKHCGCVGDPSAWWPWLKLNNTILSWVLYLFLMFGYFIAFTKRKLY